MAEDMLSILYSVNEEVCWDEHLDSIVRGVNDYQEKLKNNRREAEQHLNEILPTYWDVFHTHNTYRRKHGELQKRGDTDETQLPPYHIGIFLVGYSSIPIALSLAEIQPTEHIYFLYSEDTRDILDDIESRLQNMLNGSNDDLSNLVTNTVLYNLDEPALAIDDPSDPVSTFKSIKEIIDNIDDANNKRIALDLTGGKKTMLGGGYTAGAIWTSRWSEAAKTSVPFCDMYYVDSKEYNPSQGSPVPGTEFLSQLVNPYDVYNVQSNQQAHKLFEKHNYEAAADLWEGVKKNLEDQATKYGLEAEQKAAQSDLTMANCYKLWDDFAYREAKDYKDFPISYGNIRGFWGYQKKHTHGAIDVLSILSEVVDRNTLFVNDEPVIHYAVDRYQNAVRQAKSGKLYDAIVRFSQVIEMLCNYKIRLIAANNQLVNENCNLVSNVPDSLKFIPLIKFLFGKDTRYSRSNNRFYEIRDCNERLNIADYIYCIDEIVDLIDARNNFVHFVKTEEIKKAKRVAKKLQKLAYKFIENFSNCYITAQAIDLKTLLKLHTFRKKSLPPTKQFVKELNALSNASTDENYAMDIYNNKLQTFSDENLKTVAIALKNYWKKIDKWDGNSLSDGQRKRIGTLKSILEDNNE